MVNYFSNNEKSYYLSYERPINNFDRYYSHIMTGGGAIVGTTLGAAFNKRNRYKGAILGALGGTALGTAAAIASHLYEVNFVNSRRKSHLKVGDLLKMDFASKLPGRLSPGHHYGIYIGNGEVLSFKGRGLSIGDGRIVIDDLDELMKTRRVKFEKTNCKLTREQILDRAKLLESNYIGKYNLYRNNCEHFAREVITGRKESIQSDSLAGFIGQSLNLGAK